jgi:hypothetical protein
MEKGGKEIKGAYSTSRLPCVRDFSLRELYLENIQPVDVMFR